MDIKKYTTPKAINGGHSLKYNAKGEIEKLVTKGKPLGKGWVVSCSVNGEQLKERITTKIPVDHQEIKAEALMENWLEMLTKGYHPKQTESKAKYLKLSIKPTLTEKINEYKDYLATTTIGEDAQVKNVSRLKRLTAPYLNNDGAEVSIADKELKDVTPADIEFIINQLIRTGVFAQSTLKVVKSGWGTFFNYYVKRREIDTNPMDAVSNSIRSNKDTDEVYEPFSDEHFPLIMEQIKKFPKFEIFCQFLYHTCARPTELRKLKVSSIQGDYIRFKASDAKTKYKDDVYISEQLRAVIDALQLNEADGNDYLFSHDVTKEDGGLIYGNKELYINYCSNLFREKILKPIGLYDNTGYQLYSFKTTSNVHKMLDGWKLIELQRLNRHTSTSTTEKYLTKLSKFVKIEKKKTRGI